MTTVPYCIKYHLFYPILGMSPKNIDKLNDLQVFYKKYYKNAIVVAKIAIKFLTDQLFKIGMLKMLYPVSFRFKIVQKYRKFDQKDPTLILRNGPRYI